MAPLGVSRSQVPSGCGFERTSSMASRTRGSARPRSSGSSRGRAGRRSASGSGYENFEERGDDHFALFFRRISFVRAGTPRPGAVRPSRRAIHQSRARGAAALEHPDGRVERPTHRAVLGLAVPAAILVLLADEALDDGMDVQPEVGALDDNHAVDARLDLALEEGLVIVLPASVRCGRASTARRTRSSPGSCRIPGGARGCRRWRSKADRPRDSTAAAAFEGREERTALPEAVFALERKDPRAPALAGRPSPVRPRCRRPARPRGRGAPASGSTGRSRAASRSQSRPESSDAMTHPRHDRCVLPTRELLR